MSLRQQRRYLATTVPGRAGLAALTGIGTLTATLVPQAWANSPFGSTPVEADRAIALAQPLSGDRWNLIVLEQIAPAPPCWRRFPDGSVITYENSLPVGTCGRYLSSSAYSLRVNGDDLRHPWRLKVESNGGQLQLLASGNLQAEPLLVGSGAVVSSGLVELKLKDGWSFEPSSSSDRLARLRALGWGNRSRNSQASDSEAEDSSGIIALQVVPYRP